MTAEPIRIGSYAISTINFDNLIEENTKVQPKKKKVGKVVINKIFEPCKLICKDEFWQEKITQASIGKFPKGFSFNDGVLVYKKGAKTIRKELIGTNLDILTQFMDFFKTHGGLFSPNDLKKVAPKIVVEEKVYTWNDYNETTQEYLIIYYALDIKKLLNLTLQEMNNLRQVIRLGVINKYLTEDNFELENCRIKNIKGLLWDNINRVFNIEEKYKNVSHRIYNKNKSKRKVDSKNKDMIPAFGSKYAKLIENINKFYYKYKAGCYTTDNYTTDNYTTDNYGYESD